MILYKKKGFLGIVCFLCVFFVVCIWLFLLSDYSFSFREDDQIKELGFYDNSEEQAELRKMKQCPYDGPYVQDYHAYCDAPVFLEVECRLKSVPLEEKERENLLLERSCQTAINELSESGFFIPFDSKKNIDIEKFNNDNLKAKVVVIFDPPEQREKVGTNIDYKSIKAVFSEFANGEEFDVTYTNLYDEYVNERWGFRAVFNSFKKYTRSQK